MGNCGKREKLWKCRADRSYTIISTIHPHRHRNKNKKKSETQRFTL